jgi:hypothetical protein
MVLFDERFILCYSRRLSGLMGEVTAKRWTDT